MANDSIRGRQVVLRLTNKSGGDLAAGDVVIIDSTTAAAITTTTSAAQTADVVGVCLETIASDAIGRVCISGYVPKITLSGAASLGDTFATHSVAKQAAPNASRGGGSFGEVLGTGSTPAALLWGFPDASSAGGVAGDVIWDAAGDLVQATGSNSAARLPIGTANQLLRTNAGATATEWASVGRVLISTLTPTGTSASFTSIPATYRHLQIIFVARCDKASVTTEAGNVYVNNDTTAGNYRRMGVIGQGTTTLSGDGADTATWFQIPAATATAGACARGSVDIPFYADTTFRKMINSVYSFRRDTTTQVDIRTIGCEWENTAAIDRVDFVITGNFISGTTFDLYGIY